jgi:hypothetical protein
MRYYARAFPPAGGLRGPGQNLFTWFERARDYYFSQSRPKFEAMTLGLALLVGLVVMPVLIYLAGKYTLGAYAHGTSLETHGVFSLYYDFFKGLVECRPSCWIVLLGPFVFLSFVRLCRLILRKV